jgi:hypothetical protein
MNKIVIRTMALSLVLLSILITQGLAEAQVLPIFGAQINDAIDEARGLSQAVSGGVYWVRFDAFEWDRIEPVQTIPPSFHWENVDEGSLQRASQSGLKVIAVVKYTPDWAQKYPGSGCGPIKSTAFAAFAEFLTQAVNRYKNPPYNIQYWELGNEIDAPVYYERSVFGCWGDVSDPYFGGEYYAQMLKAAYPAIKAADPQAQVLLGGLVLDNPNEIPYSITRFFEGVLRGGGGPFFDLVNFHSYSYFTGVPGLIYNPNWPGSPTSLPEKTAFLKTILTRYGLGNKPLINTETALYCDVNTDPCFETQAVFTAKAYAEGIALGLRGLVYYALKSEWRLTGLLRPDNTPRPSYLAFQTAADFLTLAQYCGPVAGYPTGIVGHSFWPPGETPLDVIWTTDGAPQSVPLPSGAAAFDRYGSPLPISVDKITVDYGPVYIQRPIDTVKPNSSMTALPATSLPSPLPLSWSGSCGINGIAGYDLQVRVGIDGQWTDVLTNSPATNTTYTAVPNIPYYFRVRARDGAGHVEEWPSTYDTFTMIDTESPTGTLVINNGALSTTFSGVRLALSGQDGSGTVAQMRFSSDGSAWSDWEPYADSKSWTLSNGDGLKTVHVQFKDGVGNASPPLSASIILDTAAGAEYGLSINQGAPYTNQTLVTLVIGAGPFTSEMMVGNDSGFAGSPWEPYASKKSWELSRYGSYVTPRVVYVKYKKMDGTILSVYQDEIILDLNPPQGSVQVVNPPSPLTTRDPDLNHHENMAVGDQKVFLPLIQKPIQGTLVQLQLTASDDVSGVGKMMLSNHDDFSGGQWETYKPQKDWDLIGATIYVKYKDNAGNISLVYSASRP